MWTYKDQQGSSEHHQVQNYHYPNTIQYRWLSHSQPYILHSNAQPTHMKVYTALKHPSSSNCPLIPSLFPSPYVRYLTVLSKWKRPKAIDRDLKNLTAFLQCWHTCQAPNNLEWLLSDNSVGKEMLFSKRLKLSVWWITTYFTYLLFQS